MINTIFYFVKTDAEYQAKRSAGEISDKTICFVEDTREIHLGDKEYGKTFAPGLVTESYITELRNQLYNSIASINSIASTNQERLDILLNALDNRITDYIYDALHDSAALRANNELNLLIVTKIGDWGQQVSFITTDSAQWTTLAQTINSLLSTINRINSNYDQSGNLVSTEALLSIIDSRITENTTVTEIANRYSVLDENQSIIEWLASGFTSETSLYSTFNNMYSAAKSETEDAIADLNTEITQIGDNYVAKASLVSEINDKLTNGASLSGIATEAYTDNAVASIFTETVTGTGKTVSGILVQSDLDHSSLATLSLTVTDQGVTIAGLLTSTGLDTAVATLIAQDGSGVKSAITTAVSNGISAATIGANQINLEGLVTANNNFKIMNDGSMETIAGKIGGFDVTSNTISTEIRLNFDQNNYFINTFELNSLTGPTLSMYHAAYNANDDSLITTYKMFISPAGLYTQVDNGSNSNQINSSGSGFLANGTVSWDTAGNMTIDASKLTLSNGLVISRPTQGESAQSVLTIDTWLVDTTVSAAGVRTVGGAMECIMGTNGLLVNNTSDSSHYVAIWPSEIRSVADLKIDGDVYFGDIYDPEYKLDIAAAVSAGILVPVTNN